MKKHLQYHDEGFNQYLEYRNQGFKHAWELAGMTNAMLNLVTRIVIVAVITLGIYGGIQYIEDSREAAIHDSKKYSEALEKVLAKCLGDREGVVVIGEDYYFCKAIPIGVKS